MKNLSNTGLSLSHAASISNLLFQRTEDISVILNNINNCSKVFTNPVNQREIIEQDANIIPTNIVDLLLEKGYCHAAQAFLVESIKAKDLSLKRLQVSRFSFNKEEPVLGELKNTEIIPFLEEKNELELLSTIEYNEYLEVQALASHIGKFIHQDSKLDKLRKELVNIKHYEWLTPPGTKTEPIMITVNVHNTQDQLLALHTNLAALHRKYETKVNYFKAKVKNITTAKNAEIAKENKLNEQITAEYNNNITKTYNDALASYNAEYKLEFLKYEEDRLNQIKEISSLKINVDERFQPKINEYLEKLKTSE